MSQELQVNLVPFYYLKIAFLFMCMCEFLYALSIYYLQRMEHIGSPAAGVAGGCELTDMGTGD